jgi:DNA helicase-2/ATP-dependent DNA helicase PcrA
MTIQEEIIEKKEGALLVMASAGSGKTRVLTERIRKLLNSQNERFHVLALTFTNKAADEMKERLETVQDIETRSFIGTFHGFCIDVIQKHGYAIGINEQPHIFEQNEDRTSILIQVFEKPENWDLRKFYENKTPKEQQLFISNAMAYISLKKKNLKGIERFGFLDTDSENEKIQKMYREYNDLLVIQNAMDFDDVIINAYRIFANRPSIAKLYRKQYKYIFVDEAQDLNFSQYQLLKIVCNGEHNNVMMVGDIKQSLYNFNGSDIKYMKESFVQDFHAEIKLLNTNYRSAKKIIEVANHIINDSMHGYETQITGRFKIYDDCINENDEARKVVSEISNYIQKKEYQENEFKDPVANSDIAVLARSRYLLKHIEAEMKQQNIPYFFKKGHENLTFDSQIIKVFDIGLRLIINPLDQLHFSSILKIYSINEDIGFLGNRSGIEKLKQISIHIQADEKEDYLVLLQAWELLSNQSKFNFRAALDILKDRFLNTPLNIACEPEILYGDEIIAQKEFEAIKYDIDELDGYFNIYSRNTQSELKSLSHFKMQLSLGAILPEKEENGIALSTIHLSKGLEYKIVFVIGLDDGSLPFYKSKKIGGKALLEEKNIFYVAITRAKRALYLSYPKTRLMPWDLQNPKNQKPSEYLLGLKQFEND